MPKFRKKPVVIEAIQFTGDNFDEIRNFCSTARLSNFNDRNLIIPTLEGEHLASPGDWIIRGVANEFYPCKPSIFTATYDQVEE